MPAVHAGKYSNAVVPTLPGIFSAEYPYTASSVMLALRPETEYLVSDIMIFYVALPIAIDSLNTVASLKSKSLS